MTRKKKRRPNWPYRFAWIIILGGLFLYVAVRTCLGVMALGKHAHGYDCGIAFIASCLDVTIAAWFTIVGASIGSFLNVVAYRLPLGRTLGGHSGCPYCQTPIDGRDNVPVLAWIKLRGRCRTCRLPISIRYPLVELGVAIIFFVVFVTEFSSSGGNLPDGRGTPNGIGFLHVTVTSTLVTRIVVYLIALSGLVAAALIAVKRRTVPLALYGWSLAPLIFVSLFRPETVISSWRSAAVIGPVEIRLDVIATFLCGIVAAMAVARLLAPLLYVGFDRRLIASDRATTGARQFIGAMGVAGAIVGWQAVVPLCWVLIVCASAAVLLLRSYRSIGSLGDLTVWVWLGVLVFRSGWSTWMSLQPLPLPEVLRHVIGALLLAPCVLIFKQQARDAH